MRKNSMKAESLKTETIKYVGFDVHRDTISVAVADARGGEARSLGVFPNQPAAILKLVKRLQGNGELRVAYEAGGCGYGIYRLLRDMEVDCLVAAPSLIPRRSGDRVKTDRRDAERLAVLHRAGELSGVRVPDAWQEALRDLTRARECAKKREKQLKQELLGFCLRHGRAWTQGARWTKSHWRFLEGLRFGQAASQLVLEEYLDAIRETERRVKRLERQIEEQSEAAPEAGTVRALMALKGVSRLTAASLVAELGDLRRFAYPGQLMSYLGLTPSEHTSGLRSHRGGITKTGNRHLRTLLIQSAQNYRHPVRKSAALKARQKGQAEAVCRISWEAQARLCGRYRRLSAKGKPSNVVKTAIARELCGFIWAIGQVA